MKECVWCNSQNIRKHGRRRVSKRQVFQCKDCKRTFDGVSNLLPKPTISKMEKQVIEAIGKGTSRAQLQKRYGLSRWAVDKLRAEYQVAYGSIPLQKGPKRRPRKPATGLTMAYPYLSTATDKIVLQVNSLVSKNIWWADRADVCQDAILAVLEGEDIEKAAHEAVRRYRSEIRQRDEKFISIDQPMRRRGQERSETLKDILAG